MRRHLRILALLIPLAAGITGPPALAEELSKQIWLDYNPSFHLSPKTDLFGDAGVRWSTSGGRWLRMVIRPGVIVPAGRVRLSAGVGNFYTVNDEIDDRWEIRPFQGVSYTWWGDRFSIQNLARLEERFDFNTRTWDSFSSIRARYLIRAAYRWSAIEDGRSWKATAGVEPFLTLTGEEGQQRETVRATIGLMRTFAHDRRLEFDVSWQQESLFFRPDQRANDLFLRTRWFKDW